MTATANFETLDKILPYLIKSRKPILIRGKHGIGKSEKVYQIRDKIAQFLGLENKDYVYPVVERRVSQMADAGDIMGLPKIDGPSTSWLPMTWFYEACQKPVILYFDELDRGAVDVRQALFEVADSRKIAGHHLHPDTVIIACVNGSSGGNNQYQVGEFDPAELSRWSVVDLEPSAEDFFKYAKDKIEPVILDFLKSSPSFLEHTGEFVPNKVYPSRRSWFRFNEAVRGSDILEEVPPELMFLANSYVGLEASIQFLDYCKNYNRQVTVEDIIDKGKFNKVKDFSINQHMNLIDKMAENKIFKEEISDAHMDNLVSYAFKIPAELVMHLFEVVMVANPKNGIKFHQSDVQVKGRKFSGYYAEVIGMNLEQPKKGEVETEHAPPAVTTSSDTPKTTKKSKK